MINVVILNGPPGVGKDTIADALVKHMRGKGAAKHLRFKSPLYREAHDLFSGFMRRHGGSGSALSLSHFIELCTDRKTKEIPHPQLNGMSPRQSMIFTSEHVVKPVLGSDHYGVVAEKEVSFALLKQHYKMAVFSDGGFGKELVPITDEHNVLLVRLYREGFTFNEDSRNYVYGVGADRELDLHLEEGNVQFAVDEILAAMQ